MSRKTVGTVLKYALGIALLALVVWQNWSAPPESGKIGISQAIQRPLQLRPLLLTVFIGLAAALLTFVRWYVLVQAQELPFTLWNAIRLGLVGFFFNNFLPGSVGGDLVKAWYIAGEQSRRTVAVSTVLIDRVLGLWALAALVAILGSGFWIAGDPSLVDHPNLLFVVISADVLVLVSLAIWVLLGALPQWRATRFAGRLARIPWAGHAAAELWGAIWLYRLRVRAVTIAVLMALVGHVGFVLAFYFAAQVFLPPSESDQIPTLAQQFVIVPIGMTVQAFFPTPGGIGAGEYSFKALYGLLDKPEANGVLASLVARMINWALGLAGYLVFLRMRPTFPPDTPEPLQA